MPKSDPIVAIPSASPVCATVLILEDDVGVARLQKLRLERAGFTAYVTSTTSEALERLHGGGIDLLVLDNRLSAPEDGLTFYTRLKASGHDLPVILVTGYSDDATIVRALRSGVRDYVFKSVEYLDYLPEAARRIVEQERTKQQLAGSEALLQAVLNSALDPVITMDGQSRVTLMNPAAEKVFGCLESTVVGATINRLLPGVIPGIAPWANDLLPSPTELEGQHGDGGTIPLEVTCSRVNISNQVLYILILRIFLCRKQPRQSYGQWLISADACGVAERPMNFGLRLSSSGRRPGSPASENWRRASPTS
jgi:PAS domain S-box-containing protein